MAAIGDRRAQELTTGFPVGVSGNVGGGSGRGPSAAVADHRRFRVKHALKAIEDALILLDGQQPEGIELAALERIRDDLAVVLRLAEADCRRASRF